MSETPAIPSPESYDMEDLHLLIRQSNHHNILEASGTLERARAVLKRNQARMLGLYSIAGGPAMELDDHLRPSDQHCNRSAIVCLLPPKYAADPLVGHPGPTIRCTTTRWGRDGQLIKNHRYAPMLSEIWAGAALIQDGFHKDDYELGSHLIAELQRDRANGNLPHLSADLASIERPDDPAAGQ